MTAAQGNDFGRRLLISVIEERARNNDERIYASIPKSNDPRDGFHDVTYRQLKEAIDRCAWFLQKKLGPAQDFETLGWISLPSDFRYQLLSYAAMKTGYKVFLLSPRNSIEAHLHLLESTKCKVFLQPEKGSLPVISGSFSQGWLPIDRNGSHSS